jgi:hypothetical protein
MYLLYASIVSSVYPNPPCINTWCASQISIIMRIFFLFSLLIIWYLWLPHNGVCYDPKFSYVFVAILNPFSLVFYQFPLIFLHSSSLCIFLSFNSRIMAPHVHWLIHHLLTSIMCTTFTQVNVPIMYLLHLLEWIKLSCIVDPCVELWKLRRDELTLFSLLSSLNFISL